MKKTIGFALFILTVSSLTFFACERELETEYEESCRDSAWLLADSISCSGKNFFHVYPNELIAVDLGDPAVDTLVNNYAVGITYQLTGGTTQCMGAVYKNATLTCFEKKHN